LLATTIIVVMKTEMRI